MKSAYRVFWASLHVGGSVGEWVGESWEDAGFDTDDDGNPTHDVRKNTVAKFSVVDFDPANADHVDLAVDYAANDGDTSDEVIQWIAETFEIDESIVRARVLA